MRATQSDRQDIFPKKRPNVREKGGKSEILGFDGCVGSATVKRRVHWLATDAILKAVKINEPPKQPAGQAEGRAELRNPLNAVRAA